MLSTIILSTILFICVNLAALREIEAATKTAKICNNTGQTVSIAFGWTWYSVNQAKGWFPITDGNCKVLTVENADTIGLLYAYAIGRNGQEYRPSGSSTQNKFCIDRKNAFELSAAKCGLVDRLIEINTWEEFGDLDMDGLFTPNTYKWTIR